jgi:hypothetical protein
MQPELTQTFEPEDDDLDLDLKFPEHLFRSNIRNAISACAGDSDSLLGTTSDTTHLLLYHFASLIAKLHVANSLAEVRAAAAPFAKLSAGFRAKLEGGEVRLPYMGKGLDRVVSEIEQRATAVADVLQSTNHGGE